MPWNLPHPTGIADCNRAKVIGIDKCGLYVETANQIQRKQCIGIHVKEPSLYSRTKKMTLFMPTCVEDGAAN
eukprot:6802830-Ditylum_brightwellii.AAC.1